MIRVSIVCSSEKCYNVSHNASTPAPLDTYFHVFRVWQCLVEAEQQAEASGDVLPLLQILISIPLYLFLFSLQFYPLYAPFIHPLSSPFPHFP